MMSSICSKKITNRSNKTIKNSIYINTKKRNTCLILFYKGSKFYRWFYWQGAVTFLLKVTAFFCLLTVEK